MVGIASNRIAVNVLSVVAIMAALAGCESGAAPRNAVEPQGGATASELREEVAETREGTAPDWYRGGQPVLRHRIDAARDRLWVLTREGVELYNVNTREKVAHIALPRWTWAGAPYSCSPDLALGPRGEALVTSDVLPKLWRVDPVTFSVSEHEPVLDADGQRDVGFTGLTYSPDQGVFFAISSFHGSLWRIDPQLGRAQKIPLSSPVADACSLTLRFRGVQQRNARLVGLCVRGVKGGRRADLALLLAPDQRSATVTSGSCAG